MTFYDQQAGLSRSRNLKIALGAGAVLLLVGAGALAWAGVSQHQTSVAASTAASHPATVAIGTVSGAPGIPVEVPVKVLAAGGLGSASVVVTYDPKVVTLTDARPGGIAKSQLTWRHDATQGNVILLLATSIVGGVTGDNTLAILTFTAKDGAVGQVSPLSVSVRSAVHADGKDATLDTSSGSFRNGVPGDVNGDGKVDSSDYDRLASYLVGDPVSIIALNADLNGDGKVTESDAVLLLQQLDGGSSA